MLKKLFYSLKQNSIAISALVVSISALFVSISEVNTMRVEQKAMVYPHLDVGIRYNSEGFQVYVKNNGTGLAFVESVQVFFREEYFRSWFEVIDRALPDGHNIGYNIMSANNVNGRVIPAGETIEMFGVPWNEETRKLEEAFRSLEIKLLYRSILKDYWTVHRSDSKPQESPFSVPDPTKEFNP